MLEFTRSFNDTVIRMLNDRNKIYYSAYDVATALGMRDKRIAVNKVVIEEKGEFLNQVKWGSETALFISKEYVIGLTLKAENEATKAFLRWLMEVQDVAKQFYYQDAVYGQMFARESMRGHFATTQIAKGYGLSAKALNEILHVQEIQHKVNEQWVLYSKYQSQNLTKTVKIKKAGSEDEFVFHTYWTESGVKFVEDLLEKLGYQRQGSQLSLF